MPSLSDGVRVVAVLPKTEEPTRKNHMSRRKKRGRRQIGFLQRTDESARRIAISSRRWTRHCETYLPPCSIFIWLQGFSRKADLTYLHICTTLRGRKCFSAAGARTDELVAMPQVPVDAERCARSFDTRHAAAASAARQILTINARFPFSMGGGFQKLLFLALRTIGRSQALAKIILDASRRARFADT